MSVIIIKLTPEEIITLLEEKHLLKSSRFTLQEQQTYGFYYHNQIYGLYRLRSENDHFYYLKKNRYRPLRVFGNKTVREKFILNSKWIGQVWKNRNHLHNHILMISSEDPKNYFFKFYHKNLAGFIKNLTVKKSPEITKLICESYKILSTVSYQSLSELKTIGSQLFKLGNLLEIEKLISNKFVYKYSQTPLVFPLEILYQQKFIWLGASAIHYQYPQNPRLHLNSFTLINSGEDSYMEKERESLQKAFKIKKHFSSQFLTTQRPDVILKVIEESEVLHLICHGEEHEGKFYFVIRKNNLFLSLEDISQLSRTPTVVFLSSCHSDHPMVREIFFKRGTQTLITSQGPLFSHNLPNSFGHFYLRILTEKMTFFESFHLLIKKLTSLNDINAVKLRIYGFGREKLFSFKQ